MYRIPRASFSRHDCSSGNVCVDLVSVVGEVVICCGLYGVSGVVVVVPGCDGGYSCHASVGAVHELM